ncbi:recombination protein NinB [uncultured Bradyrhizobium sp.]|uniref:recombination protein NinB n=1 Tax=uncultured Bradyrhizobium sp. TaxID=199684 RepID=UPI0035CAA9C4
MSRAVISISTDIDRDRAVRWVMQVPAGTRLEFKAPKRSLPQNDRMWAMLTDVAVQLPWDGNKLSPDDWKLIFLDALKRELRMVPNIDGSGSVNLGRSSSDLSKAEMADLITLIEAFGATHGILFNYPADAK